MISSRMTRIAHLFVVILLLSALPAVPLADDKGKTVYTLQADGARGRGQAGWIDPLPDPAAGAHFGRAGIPVRSARGQSCPPVEETDVTVAPDGTLYLADGYNDRIQAFEPDGTFVRKWGGPFGMNIFGPFNGWFTTVTGIAVDPDGNIFVADFYNDRIQKFGPDGTFLTAFGETGSDPGQFKHPIAVAVAGDGTVFVTVQRVQKWRQPS